MDPQFLLVSLLSENLKVPQQLPVLSKFFFCTKVEVFFFFYTELLSFTFCGLSCMSGNVAPS